MPRAAGFTVILGALCLAACVTPLPAGPSVMALPAKDKSFADFQQDDSACRQFAAARIGNASPGAALQQSYDMSYVQCMSAKGESVPTTLTAATPYASPYPYYPAFYPYPNPYGYYYPYWGYP